MGEPENTDVHDFWIFRKRRNPYMWILDIPNYFNASRSPGNISDRIIFENWQDIHKDVIDKMIKKNNFVSFKIGYIKWLSSFIDKIKLKSIYSDIIYLDDSEICIPKKCDVIIELEK